MTEKEHGLKRLETAIEERKTILSRAKTGASEIDGIINQLRQKIDDLKSQESDLSK